MRARILFLLVLALVLPFYRLSAQNKAVTLLGSVVDSVNGRPLEKVSVYLPDDVGTSTNRNGDFRLKIVPGKTTLLLIRRIGYSPRAIRLNLQGREGRDIDLGQIVMKQIAVALDSIIIETRMLSRNPRLADFYRRKRQGQGYYITRQDIFKRQPMVATDLIRAVPGLSVECESMGACVPVSFRKIGMGQTSCPMRVLLDGLPSAVELDMIAPAWIAGVEIYKGIASTPLELTTMGTVGVGNAGCGTLVIWTGADDYEQ